VNAQGFEIVPPGKLARVLPIVMAVLPPILVLAAVALAAVGRHGPVPIAPLLAALVLFPVIGGGLAEWAALGWLAVFALFPLFNRDRLRAGDLVAGSWVVEAPRLKLADALSTGQTAASGTSQATGASYKFGEEELAIYGEFELQTLERVLRENRPEAMAAVHEAICRKLGWNPGAGDERAFLEAYYTQLRARLEGGMRMGQRKADKHG